MRPLGGGPWSGKAELAALEGGRGGGDQSRSGKDCRLWLGVRRMRRATWVVGNFGCELLVVWDEDNKRLRVLVVGSFGCE